jgi:hypothetical protein
MFVDKVQPEGLLKALPTKPVEASNFPRKNAATLCVDRAFFPERIMR